MKFFKFVIAIAIVTVLFVKCEKDDEEVFSGKTYILDASSKTNWKYFSFEKGDTVQITNPLNSLDWDIAFLRNKVKSNGGKSGIGAGAALKTSYVGLSGFNSLNNIPNSNSFVRDDSTTVEGYNPADPTHPIKTKEILNPTLYDWYTLKQGASSTLVPKDSIYIIRTAKGKIAKLWIRSYYSTTGEAAHFNLGYLNYNDSIKKFE